MKDKTLVYLEIFLIFVFVSFIHWLYDYPLEKARAEKNVPLYIAEQGADINNTLSKEVFKDSKLGGYLFVIVYKDDPKHVYYYHSNSERWKKYKYNIQFGVSHNLDGGYLKIGKDNEGFRVILNDEKPKYFELYNNQTKPNL